MFFCFVVILFIDATYFIFEIGFHIQILIQPEENNAFKGATTSLFTINFNLNAEARFEKNFHIQFSLFKLLQIGCKLGIVIMSVEY